MSREQIMDKLDGGIHAIDNPTDTPTEKPSQMGSLNINGFQSHCQFP